MARTTDGLEFYLLEVFGDRGPAAIADAHESLRIAVRDTDAAFMEKGKLYLALVGNVRGATTATRRLMSVAKQRGVSVRFRLVVEPFPEELWGVANKVIRGEVKVAKRGARQKPEEIETKD